MFFKLIQSTFGLEYRTMKHQVIIASLAIVLIAGACQSNTEKNLLLQKQYQVLVLATLVLLSDIKQRSNSRR